MIQISKEAKEYIEAQKGEFKDPVIIIFEKSYSS
jgi:hypothetical protein